MGVLNRILDWLRRIPGFLRPVVGWLIDFGESIVEGIRAAWDWSVDKVRAVVRRLNAAIREINRGFNIAARKFTEIFTVRIPGAIRWAGDRINDAVGAVKGRIESVFRWARERVGEALDAVAGLGRWVRENVLEPLGGAVRWLTDRVGGVIEWISRWGRDLARFAGEILGSVFRFFRDVAGTLYRFATRWLDGIIDFLEDPLGWLAKRLGDLATRAPRIIMGVIMRAISGAGDMIDDWLAGWFRS